MRNTFGSQNVGAGWGAPPGLMQAGMQIGENVGKAGDEFAAAMEKIKSDHDELKGLRQVIAAYGERAGNTDAKKQADMLNLGDARGLVKAYAVKEALAEADQKKKYQDAMIQSQQGQLAIAQAGEGREARQDTAWQRAMAQYGGGVPETAPSPLAMPQLNQPRPYPQQGNYPDAGRAAFSRALTPNIQYNRQMTGDEGLQGAARAGVSPQDFALFSRAMENAQQGRGAYSDIQRRQVDLAEKKFNADQDREFSAEEIKLDDQGNPTHWLLRGPGGDKWIAFHPTARISPNSTSGKLRVSYPPAPSDLAQLFGAMAGGKQPSQPANGNAPAQPTAEDIAYLKANPNLKAKFEARFGAGSAAKYAR